MSNPFDNEPFRSDWGRYCKLRPFSYERSYLFAEGLDRARALAVATALAQKFGLVPRIESLTVRQIWTWVEDDEGFTVAEPITDWVTCHQPNVWAVTLEKNKKEKLEKLWERWDLAPFTSESSFKDWLDQYGNDNALETDPALDYWLRVGGEDERHSDAFDSMPVPESEQEIRDELSGHWRGPNVPDPTYEDVAEDD